MEIEEYISVIDGSEYSRKAASQKAGFSISSLNNWLKGRNDPNEASVKKMEETVDYFKERPKHERHPSYGYATKDQIETLKNVGIGPERDKILKEIARQNKTHGKKK